MKKREQLKVGEIIKIESLFGLPPTGIYRVDQQLDSMLMLSAGEFSAMASTAGVRITERNLPEPSDWLEVEIQLLKKQVESCNCAECRKLLRSKEREAAQKKLMLVSDVAAQVCH